MLKKSLQFTAFIILLLFVFSKVTWVFRSNSGEAREDIQGFKNQKQIDVVLYGGSNLSRYYQPLQAYHENGLISYNYVSNSYTADLLQAFVEESRQSNEAMLYVCDIRTFSPLKLKETDKEIPLRTWSDSLPVFSWARIKGITSYLCRRNWEDMDALSLYFDIAKYHSNYNALANSYQWKYLNLKNINNIDKGFAAGQAMGHVPFNKPEIVNERAELTEQQKEVLYQFLDYCDQEKLNVLFIVCPYVMTEYDCSIFNSCGDIIKERGYNFVNFNYYYDEIGLNFETDFYDVNHVNYLGAEKYTDYLMNYLKDNYELPDRRGNTDYKEWDEDYAVFASMQEEWKKEIVSIVDSHLKAKEVGKKLHNINDFSTWYEAVQNENYTLIIVKDESFSDNMANLTLNVVMSKWGCDMSHRNYVGIWQGTNNVFSSTGEENFEGDIGVDGGRGTIHCNVKAGNEPQINIGDDNYKKEDGIQIVVFDNNYQCVVDNVNICADGEKICIIR